MKKILLIIAIITSCLFFNNAKALDLNALLGGDVKSTAQKEANKGGGYKSAINLDTKAKYTISSDYIYEGVLLDSQFPQKKYTYVKNLDVFILYGNRSLFEEAKKYMPWITEESFRETFSQNDMKDIIANAAGSKTREVTYGSNIFYETEKVQEIQEDGVAKNVYSIVDMCFVDDYFYSFSYSYKDQKDGFAEYREMLKTFRVLTEEEANAKPTMSKQEMLLQQEQERKQAENAQNQEATQEDVKKEEIPSTTENINNNIDKTTPSDDQTQNTENDKTTEEPQEVKEEIIEETEQEEPKKTEETLENNPEEPINEEQIVEENIENSEIVPVEEKNESILEPETIEEPISTEIKKRSILSIVVGIIWNNPKLRMLVVVLICVDLIIFILFNKHRAKKKAEKEAKKEDSKPDTKKE